jgi:hypothetical protein
MARRTVTAPPPEAALEARRKRAHQEDLKYRTLAVRPDKQGMGTPTQWALVERRRVRVRGFMRSRVEVGRYTDLPGLVQAREQLIDAYKDIYGELTF